MNIAVEYVTFRLKKGISDDEFFPASDKFNEEFLKKQNGYIARRVLKEGDLWADLVFWEDKADHLNAMEASENDDTSKEYLSMLNLSAKGSSYHVFTTVKEYK
ncbi:hypothetical protein LJC01_00590 [Clostridiaceae bacterium OttesenSCG-928-D20]|nr:hypothetical protein [Clostridiaceae bacterium OttesenSCG-928-D20]